MRQQIRATRGLARQTVPDLSHEVVDQWRLPMASREVVQLRCPVQTIVCNGKQLRTLTTECINALNLTNSPPVLFVRAGSLVRLRSDGAEGVLVEAVGDN